MKTVIHIHKSQGVVQDREKVEQWFSRLLNKLPDGDHEFWENEANKTQQQNNYYWSQISNMASYLGMDADVLHNELKDMFLPKERFIVLIKERQLETTRGLRKDWMSEYIDKCVRWSAEFCDFAWGDPDVYKHQ